MAKGSEKVDSLLNGSIKKNDIPLDTIHDVKTSEGNIPKNLSGEGLHHRHTQQENHPTPLQTGLDVPNEEKIKSDFIKKFSQQKLRAWQPVLTAGWIVSFFFVFAILFLFLGSLLLIASNKVVECVYEYPDPSPSFPEYIAVVNEEHCVGPYDKEISAPIFLYYELSNYYQNHRRYVNSRSDAQLRGNVFTNPSDVSSCDPVIVDDNNRVLSPCGLAARSVFNDSFSVYLDNVPVELEEDALVIALSSDVRFRYKNPKNADPKLVNEWLDESIFPGKVENGHFIVWMRSAALPTFRKLYARIDIPLKLPLTIRIANRYPVSAFQGKKRVVLSTVSWLGGRNNFLGIAYLSIGLWCLIFGLFFFIRNNKKPRLLGDLRYLNWGSHRQA